MAMFLLHHLWNKSSFLHRFFIDERFPHSKRDYIIAWAADFTYCGHAAIRKRVDRILVGLSSWIVVKLRGHVRDECAVVSNRVVDCIVLYRKPENTSKDMS
jgi:hypothetical protein